MKPDERLTALETGRNVSFVENMRLRLNSLTGVIRNDAFWTNKGDIAVGKKSREAGKLALGTNGQVITADDTTESGIKWATPSSGGAKSVTLIVGPASNTDSAGYDYTTDGTADQTEIQQAIDALPANGGVVLLREGTYTLSGNITLGANDVLSGVGIGTILSSSSETVDRTIGTGLLIENIKFDGVYTVGDRSTTVSHCIFTDIYDAAEGNRAGMFLNCRFIDWSSSGTGPAIATSIVDNTVIKGCYFYSANTAAYCVDYYDAPFFGPVGDANFYDCYFEIPSGYSGVMIPAATTVSRCLFVASGALSGGACIGSTSLVTENFFSLVSGGYAITPGSAVPMTISNNIITGVLAAIVMDGSGFISDNYIYDCAQDVITISADRSIVSGNVISAVASTDNTYSGILITTGITRCIISNNVIVGDNTNDLEYCISEEASCDYNIITGNVATGAQTAQINVVGANTISANNITA